MNDFIILFLFLSLSWQNDGRTNKLIKDFPKVENKSYIADLKTSNGKLVHLVEKDSITLVQWKIGSQTKNFECPFASYDHEAWQLSVHDENKDYIVLRAGCGNPCWYGLFLPLYENGEPKLIDDYIAYDLNQNYVAYFNENDSLEVLNLRTFKTEAFKTEKCSPANKTYCIGSVHFKKKEIIIKWIKDGSINSKKGLYFYKKLKI